MRVEFTVNGEAVCWQCEPWEMLTEALRRHGFLGTKRGCQSGDCGACTVLLDGEPVPSCLMLAAQAGGHQVTSIEGLGDFKNPHPIQEAFVDAAAIQCGYCTPGMVLAAKALVTREPQPTKQQVREALAGHTCRCTGYVKPIEAVLAAARKMRGE